MSIIVDGVEDFYMPDLRNLGAEVVAAQVAYVRINRRVHSGTATRSEVKTAFDRFINLLPQIYREEFACPPR